jgi:glycosyltransferase involved in cell wall biosynthesis
MKLTYIVPTINKPTLRRTLDSLQQMRKGDELIVSMDGTYPEIEQLWVDDQFDANRRPFKLVTPYGADSKETGPHNDWGAAARNCGLHYATGDFVAFLDDDDTLVAGAIETIHKAIEQQPRGPHLFKIVRKEPHNDIIWRRHEFTRGNISTQNLVFPLAGCRAVWEPHYYSDVDFIREVCKGYRKIYWHKEVIARWNH